MDRALHREQDLLARRVPPARRRLPRVLRADDADVELGGFLRLGALAVPAALAAATVIANTSAVAISAASRPTPAVVAVPSAAAEP
jgi:hypothetical protein